MESGLTGRIRDIIELTVSAYDDFCKGDTELVRILVKTVKDFNLEALYSGESYNRRFVDEFAELVNQVDNVVADLNYPLEESPENIKRWLAKLASFKGVNVEKPQGTALFYNGTVWAVVLASLLSNGMFGWPNAYFFIRKKAAREYASASPRVAAERAFERIGIDYVSFF